MHRSADTFLFRVLQVFGWLAGLIVFIIIAFLIFEASYFLIPQNLLKLFSDSSWHPLENLFNLWPMLVGSLLIGLGSLALVIPIGFATALYCHFHAPPSLSVGYRWMMQLLAGVPSVIFGLWGLVEIVPLIMAVKPPGASLLAGIVIVALMILPTFFIIIDAGLLRIPPQQISAAHSMGFDRFTLLTHVVLPNIKGSFFTASVLSFGRALGETMAVVMVCGNIVQIPEGLFAPVRTLTANIALEMAYAVDVHRSSLFMSGLLLTLMISSLIFFIHLKKFGVAHAD